MADPFDTADRERLTAREVADRFIEAFYHQGRLADAFRAWVHPDYIQHHPSSPTGRDGTIEVLAEHMERHPHMSHDVKRVIYGADGLMAVHYLFRFAPEDRGMAVIDLFRIEGGYLVEHWDVIQAIPDPATCKNQNGMF